MVAKSEPTTVLGALDQWLAALTDRTLATSTEAMTARGLARTLDDSGISPGERTACSRELRGHLATLRELAPPAETDDALDRMREKLRGGK